MIDGWDSVSVGNKEVTRDNAVIFMVKTSSPNIFRISLD